MSKRINLDSEISTRTYSALAKIVGEYPQIEEIENAGMDAGRFFVRLRVGCDWQTDPANVLRTRSFGSAGEVREALKTAKLV